jgi:hypothetical protein
MIIYTLHSWDVSCYYRFRSVWTSPTQNIHGTAPDAVESTLPFFLLLFLLPPFGAQALRNASLHIGFIICTQSVGLLGRSISARRKDATKQTQLDSNPRCKCSSAPRHFMP